MEAEDRGWNDVEKYVCEDCVEDEFLKTRIRSAPETETCEYCGREGKAPIAAPVHIVLESVVNTIAYYFSDPTNAGLPHDDGWIIEPTDTEGVLLKVNLTCHADLFADIANAIVNDAWIPTANGHWLSLHQDEVLRYSWDSFCQWIKYESRFFFSQVTHPTDDHDRQEIESRNVLPSIASLVTDLGLISILPQDTVFYRARNKAQGDDWMLNAKSMGSPPSLQASAGRMNPAGISYLYLAFSEMTAVVEVIDAASLEVAVAEFALVRDLRILDLTGLPIEPSVFDEERRDQREGLVFLKHFVQEISKPVAKDGYEHINYVPSQVVSEFFALVFKNDDGIGLDGIIFPSSVHPGGKNLVLFPTDRGIARRFDTVQWKSAEIKQVPSAE